MFRLLGIFLSCVGLINSEPVCSRFHYEEQTLRKMIEVEILVEQFRADLKRINNDVSDALAELKTKQQTGKRDLDLLRASVEKDVAESIQQVNKALHDAWEVLKTEKESSQLQLHQLRETVRAAAERNKEEIKAIRDSTIEDEVLFVARNLENLNPSSDEKLLFNVTDANMGSAYDSFTGIFTVPVTGTYIFTLQLCVILGYYADFEITTENRVLLNGATLSKGSPYECQDSVVPAFLSAGETVWVKTGSVTGSRFFEDTPGGLNMFSGVLINK